MRHNGFVSFWREEEEEVFVYEYTSLKLAILMYYDILRNISEPV